MSQIFISTFSDLQNIRDNLSGNYVLVNDIDCTNKVFVPLPIINREGSLDGNNFKLLNFTTQASSIFDSTGLYSEINNPEYKVKNLHFINVNIIGEYKTGALVGCLKNGMVENVTVNGGLVSGKATIGGVVGENIKGTIMGCSSNANVVGVFDTCGGFIGKSISGTIKKCFSTGNVSLKYGWAGGFVGRFTAPNPEDLIEECFATGLVTSNFGNYIGGFAGCLDFKGNIKNCFARGNVVGHMYLGGFIGGLLKTSSGQIINCYSTGSTKSTIDLVKYPKTPLYAGGFCGQQYSVGCIVNSYFDSTTAGKIKSWGGFPLNTTQMGFQESFYSWDFNIWSVNGYPYLQNIFFFNFL